MNDLPGHFNPFKLGQLVTTNVRLPSATCYVYTIRGVGGRATLYDSLRADIWHRLLPYN